jgi:hypothetical protein
MPGTPEEHNRIVQMLCAREIAADFVAEVRWADGDSINAEEMRDIFILAVYEIRRRNCYDRRAQRKALRLIRRFLTPVQKRQMRDCKYFHLTVASGAVYRLYPYRGRTGRVELHKTRFFETQSFCLHDFPEANEDTPRRADRPMPPADVTLAHLLLLSCDEDEFLRTANMTPIRLSMWDGEYLRRMRQRRTEDAMSSAGEHEEAANALSRSE